MATNRDVRCRTCGRVWSSGAKAKNLKCNKECKSIDIEDNYVNPEATSQVEPKTINVSFHGRSLTIPEPLYERATKKVGLDHSQIVAYPDVESLKRFCDKVHPASNPDAMPKAAVIPSADDRVPEPPPDMIEFDSKLEAQFVTMNRASFDNNTLQAEMRKVNRKYGTQKPVRITTDQACKAVDGTDGRGISVKYLVTHFIVYYRE